MKENTNTINETEATALALEVTPAVKQDFWRALFTVSILVNLFIFIGWLILRVTSIYDYQIAMFLFYR